MTRQTLLRYVFTGMKCLKIPKSSCGKRLQGAVDARRRACRRTLPYFKYPATPQMRCPVNAYILLILLTGLAWMVATTSPCAEDEYGFDMTEFASKPFEWGGHADVKWEHMDTNTRGALYRLKHHDDHRSTLDRLTSGLQLDGLYKKGTMSFKGVVNVEGVRDETGGSDSVEVYEANLNVKHNRHLSLDMGKKAHRWGNGYAWNPSGFMNRPKDPNNPEEILEGYTGAGMDWVKSFNGPLQSLALNLVALPVSGDINNDFGTPHHVNIAAKLYLLYRDTDIDVMVFSGNSRSTRYGFDFSRNLAPHFEIHGEFAHITRVDQEPISGQRRSAEKYLAGLRYLTENEITAILEYYHNGAGLSEGDMDRFYALVEAAEIQFTAGANDALYRNARRISRQGYTAAQAGRNYLYLKINQPEPFDLLYLTPSVICIFNLDDKSYSVTPELTYTGLTDWKLRLRFSFLNGAAASEFGEKQNENKLELRAQYYF
jgi:hypothetical protein